MAFTPNKYLTEDTTVVLRDRQHAARIFVDDQFRLAPKYKNLFHVAFGINTAACKDAALLQRHKNEINVLVKSVDLPSFTITTDTVVQYNRKKVIQSQHEYGEFEVVFHDDNMGLINKLWQNYYSYYYADSTSALSPGAYSRNATRNSNFISSAYGLDNGSNAPFFNYIMIYQMARHEYVSYKLINPMITSWNHNKMEYSDSKLSDFTFKFKCEAVAYGSGTIANDPPEGFALEHYDLTPSPLSGISNNTSASPTFTDNRINATEIIQNTIEQINTYQNSKTLKNAGISGIINSIGQPTTSTQGIAFPVKTSTSSTTVASLIKIG